MDNYAVDRTKLRPWLENRPYTWAQSIAMRAALRTLPFLNFAPDIWLDRYSLIAIRPLLIAWSAQNFPQLDWPRLAIFMSSTDQLDDSALETDQFESPVDYVVLAAVNAAQAVEMRRGAKTVAVDAIDTLSMVEGAVETAQKANFRFRLTPQDVWDYVRADEEWFDKNIGDQSAARILSRRSLWLGQQPTDLAEIWHQLAPRLISINSDFSVWIDWYERRIRGERAGFDIPGDKGRIEDKKILRRLAEATDEDFWGKGHEYVNATLKGWLDEARARVAPPSKVVDASATVAIGGFSTASLERVSPKLPNQNVNALSFVADDQGKIAVDATALVGQLRADPGAQDRHAEAMAEARLVLDRCQLSNSGARMTGMFENYIAAGGETLAEAQPSLLVQRGERLRQEIAAYVNPDSFLAPLADDLLLDMKGWLSAHNMMVGLDPVLNVMDTAMLGPDRQPALISPEEIREKAREADDADLLQDGVAEVVEEAADLAPAIPDPNDRHTIWSTEMVRNLMIETASVALNNPIKTGAIVAGFTGGGVVGGISIMGSIKAAEYLVNHKEWVLARLGNTPTWQALIAKLIDWLEEVTPFERN